LEGTIAGEQDGASVSALGSGEYGALKGSEGVADASPEDLADSCDALLEFDFPYALRFGLGLAMNSDLLGRAG